MTVYRVVWRTSSGSEPHDEAPSFKSDFTDLMTVHIVRGTVEDLSGGYDSS